MDEGSFRLAAAIIIISAFAISAYFRRKADRETKERISREVDGILMMTIIKAGGLILWLSPLVYIFKPGWLSWSDIALPQELRILGIGIGFICTVLVYWLFSSIGSGISPTSATRKKHQLVTSGPYRYVRHPLYTVGSTLFVSLGLIADSWLIILLGVMVFVIMAVRTPKEEANLIEKFGDEYKDYMAKTGRFFPRIRLL